MDRVAWQATVHGVARVRYDSTVHGIARIRRDIATTRERGRERERERERQSPYSPKGRKELDTIEATSHTQRSFGTLSP